MSKAPAFEPRRILVVAPRQIGDVLLTTPLVRACRLRWPRVRIDFLGFQGTLGMLAGNPDLQGQVEMPRQLGLRGGWQLLRRLWKAYDLALVTDGSDRAHLLGWVAATHRSGNLPPEGGSNWWKKRLLDHAVLSAGGSASVHVIAEKLALLEPWASGDTGGNGAQAKVVPPAAQALPPAFEGQLRPRAVVVHAPSMWTYKQWPIGHYQQLVSGLLARGQQVVLTGSGGAHDQECIAPLRTLGTPPQLLDASGQLSFGQLVTLLQRAALYIGPDTSITHLAAATGVPVIGVFGPTNPARWGPWPAQPPRQNPYVRVAPVQRAANVTLVQGERPCVPCAREGCANHRQSRSECLQDIGPQQVLHLADELLAHRNAA